MRSLEDSVARAAPAPPLTPRQNAHKTAVTVHAGAVALLFPPAREQRLAHIQVGALDKSALTVTFKGAVLSSPSHPLTRAGVARALGPTYAAGTARLAYPGVAFELSQKSGREDLVTSLSVSPREDHKLPAVEPLAQAILHVRRSDRSPQLPPPHPAPTH